MRLIDILVRELPKRGGWPQGATDTIEMHMDGAIYFDGSCAPETFELPQCNDGWDCGMGMYSNEVTREQYEAALKQPVWDGTGVPPVGVEIEVSSPRYGWKKAVVTAVTDNWLIAKYDDGAEFAGCHRSLEDGVFVDTNLNMFRPIRSERDEAIERMRKVVTNYNKTDVIHAIEQLYDAGYRKLSD